MIQFDKHIFQLGWTQLDIQTQGNVWVHDFPFSHVG